MFSRLPFKLKTLSPLKPHSFSTFNTQSPKQVPKPDGIFHTLRKYINKKTIGYTLAGSFAAYLVYEYNPYMTQIVLSYDKNPLNEEIVHNLPSLYNQHFYPSILCTTGLLQAIMNHKLEYKPVVYHREPITLSDGGRIVLDWALPKKQIEYTGTPLSGRYYPYEPSKDNKILLVLHGLTGGSETTYIQTLVEDASKRGYRVAVLNQRGVNQPLSSPKTFHGGFIEDLAVGVEHIRKTYPNAPIVAIGTSFGGNQLLRYLAQVENKTNILGAVLLSPPFNIDDIVNHIENTVYEDHFVKKYFEQTFLPNYDVLQSLKDSHGINFEEVLKIKSLRDFHKYFTIKLFEHKDVEEYFSTIRIHDSHINNVKVPMLVLHAKDDPISVHKSVPVKSLSSNPNIIVAETSRGGHLCWFTGLKPKRWYSQPTMEFLDKIMELKAPVKKPEPHEGVKQLGNKEKNLQGVN